MADAKSPETFIPIGIPSEFVTKFAPLLRCDDTPFVNSQEDIALLYRAVREYLFTLVEVA